MAQTAILRKAGIVLFRAPLLWLFSAAVVLTTQIPVLGGETAGWACLLVLLFPVTVVARAGQIYAVWLRHEGRPTSFSEIIRSASSKMWPLMNVEVAGGVLWLTLAGPILWLARFLSPPSAGPVASFLSSAIATVIVMPFIAFGERGIVISGLRAGANVATFFRALRHEARTVVPIVAALALLNLVIGSSFATAAANSTSLVARLLALLVLEATQAAAFTFTYLHVEPRIAPRVEGTATAETARREPEMATTVLCPRCGTANPAIAMNCAHCRVNLRFAQQHPEALRGEPPVEPPAGPLVAR